MGLVRPKKSLGQHFLADANIARKIAESLQAKEYPVLEIGPGMGMLTRYLLEMYPENLWVVEIDRESVAYLEGHFPALRGRILQADFLLTDLSTRLGPEVCWIGNLPYNISSPIFFRLLEQHKQVPEMVAMIQKEVAERIAAPHGSKTYGILSVLLQAYYEVEYLFTVSEKVFNPPPKVKSGVIRLKRRADLPGCDFNTFRMLVKTAFNQRRKMLRNALSQVDGVLDAFPMVAEKRAEQIPVADYLVMAEYLGRKKKAEAKDS